MRERQDFVPQVGYSGWIQSDNLWLGLESLPGQLEPSHGWAHVEELPAGNLMGSDWKWGRMWRKWVKEGSASGPFSSLTENTAVGSEQSQVTGQESLVCCHPRVCCREACRPGKQILLGSIWGQHCIGSLWERWIQDCKALYNVSLMGVVGGLWEGCMGGCMVEGFMVGGCKLEVA